MKGSNGADAAVEVRSGKQALNFDLAAQEWVFGLGEIAGISVEMEPVPVALSLKEFVFRETDVLTGPDPTRQTHFAAVL